MVTLKVPVGTASAELQRVAVSGQRAVALGQEIWPSGARTAFAEVSADGGRTWQPVSLPSPHGDAAVTAVTPLSGGFTAVGTDGTPGDRDVVVWTSADGSGWTIQAPDGTGLSGPGVQQITGLAASGGTLTGWVSPRPRLRNSPPSGTSGRAKARDTGGRRRHAHGRGRPPRRTGRLSFTGRELSRGTRPGISRRFR